MTNKFIQRNFESFMKFIQNNLNLIFPFFNESLIYWLEISLL